MTRVLAVVNLKGGSSKTTSAAFLAHALARLGRRVIGVDTDPQGSLQRWQGLAQWSIPVLGMATTTVHRQIWGVVDQERFDTALFDTPPLEERAGIVASVLRIATDVIVPLAPSMMELDRVGPVWQALDDALGHRDTDPNVSILLTRTIANATSTKTVREVLTSQNRHVLQAHIPRREQYAQAFGDVIGYDGAYEAAAIEISKNWEPR